MSDLFGGLEQGKRRRNLASGLHKLKSGHVLPSSAAPVTVNGPEKGRGEKKYSKERPKKKAKLSVIIRSRQIR